MERFMYVFTTKDRDYLVNAGLQVIKEDKKNNMFVFLRNEVEWSGIPLDGIIYIYSDILTYS